MKMYHFQTEHYGAHKASDAYLAKFLANLDRFMEAAQGQQGTTTLKKVSVDAKTLNDKSITTHLRGFANYLRNLTLARRNADLAAIRDEMLADVNQFSYLLTFQ